MISMKYIFVISFGLNIAWVVGAAMIAETDRLRRPCQYLFLDTSYFLPFISSVLSSSIMWMTDFVFNYVFSWLILFDK